MVEMLSDALVSVAIIWQSRLFEIRPHLCHRTKRDISNHRPLEHKLLPFDSRQLSCQVGRRNLWYPI